MIYVKIKLFIAKQLFGWLKFLAGLVKLTEFSEVCNIFKSCSEAF